MTETDKVLLCGSIPGDFADEAMTLASRIADLVPAIPDGETGDRSRWVIFQAYRVFDGHPQIETLNRPKPGPGKPDWVPAPFPEGLEEFWTFRIRDNVTDVQFPNLLYASMAERSYETFVSLRQQGKIPDTVRFQVSLPLPESGYSWFFPDAGDLERISRPYEQAMIAELEQILNSIPHHDLAIQWDVCYEVLDIEGAFPWSRPSDPFKRYQETVSRIGPCVPEQVQMGYHLCWGDLGHQHLKEPDDLALAVRMANAAVARSGRRVDWVHMPVPRDRTDDRYFEPLHDLDVGDTRVYLGLVHFSDGFDGTKTRLEAARRHLGEFGVATECGFGRRSPETTLELLELHRQIVSMLEHK